MAPADWLLLLIASRPERAIDPVRVQKGLFLLAMEGGIGADASYAFEPYSFGPMSRAIYADVRMLEAAGLIESIPVAGHGWRVLRATAAGLARAAALPARHEAIDRVRARVDQHSFAELLEHVYERYPEFSTRSVFRRRS